MNKRFKFMSISILLASTLSLSLSGCSLTKNTSEASTSQTTDQTSMSPTYKDVVFATVKKDNGENRDLKMNIFKPDNATEDTPVLVYIHGGGWAMGDYQGDDASEGSKKTPPPPASNESAPKKATDQIAGDSAYKVFKRVLNSGITFVSIDYRLSSEAALPAQIYDVKGSIRYLRAHAEEYGINPDKIAVAGNSAGGHLTAELATTGYVKELEGDVGDNLDYSSKVIAAVDYYGPTDLLTMGPEMDLTLQSAAEAVETHDSVKAAESKLLGFTSEGQGVGVLRAIRDKIDTTSPYWSKVKLAEISSPINNVTSDDPPMFIAHGGSDSLVPIQQSLRLREALTHAGVENMFMSNSKAPHGSQGEDVNNAAVTWITNKLLN